MEKKGLKYRIRDRAIKSAVSKNKRLVVFPKLDLIRSVGVIREAESSFDFNSKKLTGNARMVFLDIIKEKISEEVSENVISLSNLNFWGLPADKKIKPFISEPVDLLINFLDFKNDVADYICAWSKAKFKVNTSYSGDVYDLVIDQQPFNGSLYIDELEKAISNFNTLN